jgi:hypothetical protein
MYYIYVIIINTYIEHVEMQVYSFFFFLSFFSQAVCDWQLTEYECIMCEKL